jgi:hypothetical protein
VAVVADQGGVSVYIADYYNGKVRVVGPDGIIRDVGDEQRVRFGAPTRVEYTSRRGSLWVADSTLDRLVALIIRKVPPATSARAPSARRRTTG